MLQKRNFHIYMIHPHSGRCFAFFQPLSHNVHTVYYVNKIPIMHGVLGSLWVNTELTTSMCEQFLERKDNAATEQLLWQLLTGQSDWTVRNERKNIDQEEPTEPHQWWGYTPYIIAIFIATALLFFAVLILNVYLGLSRWQIHTLTYPTTVICKNKSNDSVSLA